MALPVVTHGFAFTQPLRVRRDTRAWFRHERDQFRAGFVFSRVRAAGAMTDPFAAGGRLPESG